MRLCVAQSRQRGLELLQDLLNSVTFDIPQLNLLGLISPGLQRSVLVSGHHAHNSSQQTTEEEEEDKDASVMLSPSNAQRHDDVTGRASDDRLSEGTPCE